jgi:hypothetical protein
VSEGPAYQALVFVAQVATFGALGAWWLRGTRPGRDVCKAVQRLAGWPRRRRAAKTAQALAEWQATITWWAHLRSQRRPGTREYEAANDMVTYLQNTRPGPCPHEGFTCTRPHCPSHPRSHQP